MFLISDSCIACFHYSCLLQPCTTWPSILVFSHLTLNSCILERNLLLFISLTGLSNCWVSIICPQPLCFPTWPYTTWPSTLVHRLLYFPTWPWSSSILALKNTTRIRLAQLPEVETKQSRKSTSHQWLFKRQFDHLARSCTAVTEEAHVTN